MVEHSSERHLLVGRSVTAGFFLGIVPLVLAGVLWYVVPNNEVTATLVELVVPATLVAGLVFITLPDYRRMGVGIVLSSAATAAGAFAFFWWAFSNWGS